MRYHILPIMLTNNFSLKKNLITHMLLVGKELNCTVSPEDNQTAFIKIAKVHPMAHQAISVKIMKAHTHSSKDIHPKILPQQYLSLKKWKQFRRLSTRNCLHNLWYRHTIKFFAAMKMNKSALYVMMWKHLQNVLLNEKRCRAV